MRPRHCQTSPPGLHCVRHSEEEGLCDTLHPSHSSVLKATVKLEWANMSEDFLVKSCRSFWPRIEAALERRKLR